MPGNLGMTIFEHLLAQEQQKQMLDQQRAEQAKQDELLMNQKLQEAVAVKTEREDKDFDRRLKIADLWGKYGAQAGEEAPREMNNPALQEMANAAFLGGKAENARWGRVQTAKEDYNQGRLDDLERKFGLNQEKQNHKVRMDKLNSDLTMIKNDDLAEHYEELNQHYIRQDAALQDRVDAYARFGGGHNPYREMQVLLQGFANAAKDAQVKYQAAPTNKNFEVVLGEARKKEIRARAIFDSVQRGAITEEEAIQEMITLAPEMQGSLHFSRSSSGPGQAQQSQERGVFDIIGSGAYGQSVPGQSTPSQSTPVAGETPEQRRNRLAGQL